MGRSSESGPWWREAAVVWLLALVGVAYFSRAAELPLRGEEPTRALIAREMVQRGDWIVPRQQGEPFLIRPPLQNWLIAASCLAWNSWGSWAVRFPSLVATLLTTLLVYGYSRLFLSRHGALAAGVGFATFADMFQMGRQAETEAVFTFFVSASLLLSHAGLLRGWPETWTYGLGYGFMGLAMLTKGVQAPVYFVGAVSGFLVLTRQWRRLFCRGHVAGALVGAAVLLAWIVPYARAVGWDAVPLAWVGDPAVTYNGRWQYWVPARVAAHLLTYPLEIFAGLLPWSPWLLLYAGRELRRATRPLWPQASFLVTCLVVAFPTCWIPPGGLPRYFAPLFPCLAVLIGMAIQHCAEAETPALRNAWRHYLMLIAGISGGAAILVLAFKIAGHGLAPVGWIASWPTALAYAVASVVVSLVLFRLSSLQNRPRLGPAVLTIGAFLVIVFTGMTTDARCRRSVNGAEEVARIQEMLPPGQPLLSLDDHPHSLFAYLYDGPILTPRQWSERGPTSSDSPYFCVMSRGSSRPQLPFPWDELGTVCVDRNRLPAQEQLVVVGRRR